MATQGKASSLMERTSAPGTASTEPELTPSARTVLEKRYLWKDQQGAPVETPGGLFARVARAIAAPEKPGVRGRWERRYLEMMLARRFIPNTPTLMNAGRSEGQLSACFVLPVEDSLDGIFDALKHAAKIHQSGGGTGFGFSRLRGAGSLVKSTHGVASGPVSFIRVFDIATETIKQGGARRGANMAVLRVDHPDIIEFIDSKRDQRSIINFNISVGITQAFMTALRAGAKFELRDPRSGVVVKELEAEWLFSRIVQAAWECGDPGLVFLDRANFVNPTPKLGDMESTNPCGEQPLLPYESCNLGSLNLGAYLGSDLCIDWGTLRTDVHAAVRFLDTVIDVNRYPIPECARITRRNRKIGLGVMGYADLLLLVGIPYGSAKAIALGEQLMSFVDREAKSASRALAQERGPFANFRGSLWDRLGYPPLRNATVSTVAPTGTISILAGASSGIEPIFSAVYVRNVLSGSRLRDVHPSVARAFRLRDLNPEQVTEEEAAKVLGAAWTPAWKVPVEAHVRTQAAFQRHSDSAVSKTINLPEAATLADVRKAYLHAYDWGCKGITVYRDRSRSAQVLEPAGPKEDLPGTAADGIFCPSC